MKTIFSLQGGPRLSFFREEAEAGVDGLGAVCWRRRRSVDDEVGLRRRRRTMKTASSAYRCETIGAASEDDGRFNAEPLRGAADPDGDSPRLRSGFCRTLGAVVSGFQGAYLGKLCP